MKLVFQIVCVVYIRLKSSREDSRHDNEDNGDRKREEIAMPSIITGYTTDIRGHDPGYEVNSANPAPGYEVNLPRLPAIPILVQDADDYEIYATGGVSNPTQALDKMDVEKDREYQSLDK